MQLSPPKKHEDASEMARRICTLRHLFSRLERLSIVKVTPGHTGLAKEVLKAGSRVASVLDRLQAISIACMEWRLPPLSWSRAVVCPLNKKGPPIDACDYQPNSSTETLPKLYEAVILGAIEEERGLAPPLHLYQNGFFVC